MAPFVLSGRQNRPTKTDMVISISNEICGLLGYYTASCGNYLPTFRDNVSVPSSRVKIPSGKKAYNKKLENTAGSETCDVTTANRMREGWIQGHSMA
jgi:hypothetical protein